MTLEKNLHWEDVEDCSICREPRNRHMIVGKLVDVEQWHAVFTGMDAKPSDEFKTVAAKRAAKTLRPLIARPLIPEMEEGTEKPQYKGRPGGIWGK